MKKYLVHVMYDVAKASPGSTTQGALARGWGPGHRFSVWHDHRLAVQAQVRAESAAAAIELADARVRALWGHRPGGAITLTLSRATRERVLVGAGRRLRFAGPGFAKQLGGRWAERSALQLGEPWLDPDQDDEDGGGTAGVREPRRPGTPPGTLHAAAELPGPSPSR
jgi:hypothetical protein